MVVAPQDIMAILLTLNALFALQVVLLVPQRLFAPVARLLLVLIIIFLMGLASQFVLLLLLAKLMVLEYKLALVAQYHVKHVHRRLFA